ncbi:MAG TPA: molybdate ABC transporter substrate-binding protein [Flavobacteriales bacterium]|nr:molybdate ABC transporter substrate-binding protein [Flavobacteriales bacterium]HIO67210.1 molybdate ABC transporter substrate-binding protein [Flavobacteriales bacterium]
MKITSVQLVSLLVVLLVGCAQPADKQEESGEASSSEIDAAGEKLTVAAAANLRFVLAELEIDFEKNNATDLEIIFASSGKLTSQIINGAPFDVFLSANMKFPLKLVKEKMTTGKPIVYALGTLIMWSTKDLDLSKGLSCLLDDDIEKIAIASDKNAPYGSAALEALKSAQVYSKIESKLVYGESVSQVNQYVKSESVDVGLTNKSVIIGMTQDNGIWHDVDTALYTQIDQGIVITNHGEEHRGVDCQTFLNYLFSPSAQEIFAKYGYLAP